MRHDQRADAVREVDRDLRIPMRRPEVAEHQREVGNREPRVGMPHRRADEDLNVDEDGGRGRRAAERGVLERARVLAGRDVSVDPAGRCEQRDRHRHAEEDLGEAGVSGRDGGRQEEEHGQPAEDALGDDGAESGRPEPFHPAARFAESQPRGEDDRQEADRARDETVTVFVEDAADPLRRREREHVPAVRGRPIGNGEARAGARDEASGEDEQYRTACDECGETVEAGIHWRVDKIRQGRVGLGRVGRAGRRAEPCAPDLPDLPGPPGLPGFVSRWPRQP